MLNHKKFYYEKEEKQKVKKIVSLTKEECHCCLSDFYVMVAEKAGYTENEATMYNATKIHITKAVQDEIWNYYLENSVSEEGINQTFLIYGAKADLEGNNYIAVLDDGFVENGDHDRTE